MKVLFVVAVCAMCVYGGLAQDYFPKCKRSDPQIHKCILDAIELMRPQLKEGIPMVNIPPLDPFKLPTLRLNRTAPNLRLKATVTNTTAYGGSNFRIHWLRVHVNKKYSGEIKLFFPKLVVDTTYDVRGSQLLTLTINGKGRLRGNFTGITVVAKGNAKPIVKDGLEYLQADKIITRVKIGNGQISFADTESPIAAASAASFFNASPGVVFDIITPLIEETSAAVIKAFINKVLSSIPLKEYLIDE